MAINVIHPNLPMTGTQVMMQVQKITWNYILDTWHLRNTHLHHNAAQLNLPNYQQATTNLYEQWHLLPPAAQEALYRQPLKERLKQPAPRFPKWTQWGLKYFTQQLRAAKSQAKLQTPDIQTFFCKQTQQPNDLQPPWETLFSLNQCGSSLYAIGLER